MTLWQALTLALLASVVGIAVLLVAVMRQVGSILMVVGTSTPLSIPAGPKIGSVLPVPGTKAKRPVLVVFVSPECTQCRSLLPGLTRLETTYREQLELVAVVANAEEEERRRHAEEIGAFARADLPLLYDEWNVPGTPFAVALDSERRVRGSAIVNTLDQLETVAVAALAVAPVERPEAVDGVSRNVDRGAHARTGEGTVREGVVT